LTDFSLRIRATICGSCIGGDLVLKNRLSPKFQHIIGGKILNVRRLGSASDGLLGVSHQELIVAAGLTDGQSRYREA
jgi:hypothetical protein